MLLLGLLFTIVIASIGLAGTGVLWQFEGRREKEKELLFIGDQYSHAIASYYERSPGDNKQYPEKLTDLLEDKRSLVNIRHLRRLYRDPMTPTGEWTLIRQQGRITGIASSSNETPIKIAGFRPDQEGFDKAKTYAEWKFTGAKSLSQADAQANVAQSDGGSPLAPQPATAGPSAVAVIK